MFGRNKKIGYDTLSAGEKDLARALGKKSKRDALALEFIKIHNSNLLKYYLDNFTITPQQHHSMILCSIREKCPDTLKVIIEENGIYPWQGYKRNKSDYTERETSVIYVRCATAKEHQDQATFQILADQYKNIDGNDKEGFVTETVFENWKKGFDVCIEAWSSVTYKSLYEPSLYEATRPSVSADVLEHIITKGKESITQGALNDALHLSIKRENTGIEKVCVLLTRGASPNALGDTLIHIARNGNRACFDLLVQYKLDINNNVPLLIDILTKESPSSLMIPYMEELLRGVQKSENKKDSYDLITPEQLREKTMLSANMTLTTIFNFQLREETKITENTKTGQMTMTMRNLDELPSATVAFLEAKFLEKNGKPEILTHRMNKPKVEMKSMSGGKNVHS